MQISKSFLAMAVGAALGAQLNMAQGSGGSVSYNFDKDHIKSWAEEGLKAGKFAQSVFATADVAVKDMMCAIASTVAGSPSAEDFLTGYSKAWSNPDTGKSRKTDFRAVMDAFALKDADGKPLEFEITVGYEKNADGSNKLDDNKNAIPIKIKKTAQDWLLEYDSKEGFGANDGFKGFLQLARYLRNQGSGRQSQGTAVNRKQKVTEKQLDNIMEQIPVMNSKQAHATVYEGLKALAKMPGYEVALLNEMELTCNMLKASKNPIFVEAAAGIIDVLNDAREKLANMEKLAQEAKANTTGGKEALHQPSMQVQADFKAPIPAEQKEQKAA